MDEKRSKELTDETLDAVSGGRSVDEMREKLIAMEEARMKQGETPSSPIQTSLEINMSTQLSTRSESAQSPALEMIQDIENPGYQLF